MTIQIITDGGSDLPIEMRDSWRIKVIPLIFI